MAYAAVLSLMYTIKDLLGSSRISIASSTREILQSAYHHANSLRTTLKDCGEGVKKALEERIIIEEARKLEDAIESCPPKSFLNVDQLRKDVDCFAKTAKEMEENTEELWEQKVAKMIEEYIEELFVPKTEEEDVSSANEECDMVGLFDQFCMIRDELAASERAVAPFQYMINPMETVVWISGMAGIGKTTLAKKIFHDPWVKENFECRAFVRVGQEFRLKKVLQAITAQLNLDNDKMIMEGDENLYESFLRILTIRKSLIVLDDVWEDECLSPLFETRESINDPGSRILVTNRTDAFYYSRYSCNLKMRFMNEEESWELLRRKVFDEEEECPPLLVKAGKKIAEKCEGLPLLIIAVAPILLSKAQKIPECWNRVANNPDSVLEDATHQISEVLWSSYHHTIEEFKLCFLYIAAFPQNYIVWHSTIINLWCAEGFYFVTKEYWPRLFYYSYAFKVLHLENLVVGHQERRKNGTPKSCHLHCAYWFLSKRVAENNRFLYIINRYEDVLDERVKSHHRLAIYTNVLLAIKEVHNKIASISTVRSLLCTGPYHQYQVPICWEWKLLRVLHALTIRFYEFPVEVVKLIRLRYLALTCNANLPPSISKLWNLEFLIVHQHSSIKRVAAESYVPVEIWDLHELEHLQIMGRNLPDPRPGAVLPNLRKLLDVGVESCTQGVLESTPKLKKLRIQIVLAPHAAETLSCFHHISCFSKLESFQSVIMNPTLLRPPPPLSISTSRFRKLTLSGFGYPWEETSKIAELPNLQVLKLQCYAFRGEKWEAKEMRFSSLEYLIIEDTDLVQWTAGDETFPKLKRLTMKNCHKLHEIPRLSYRALNMELDDCNPLAETCAKRKHMVGSWRNAKRVTITANYSWNEEKLIPHASSFLQQRCASRCWTIQG